ncbi:hypothetical protein DA718_18645 [Klebsiella huaxiensis]|nr:hypothetical protein DA718_18645 [Klebsiella huaxiensis]
MVMDINRDGVQISCASCHCRKHCQSTTNQASRGLRANDRSFLSSESATESLFILFHCFY